MSMNSNNKVLNNLGLVIRLFAKIWITFILFTTSKKILYCIINLIRCKTKKVDNTNNFFLKNLKDKLVLTALLMKEWIISGIWSNKNLISFLTNKSVNFSNHFNLANSNSSIYCDAKQTFSCWRTARNYKGVNRNFHQDSRTVVLPT